MNSRLITRADGVYAQLSVGKRSVERRLEIQLGVNQKEIEDYMWKIVPEMMK